MHPPAFPRKRRRSHPPLFSAPPIAPAPGLAQRTSREGRERKNFPMNNPVWCAALVKPKPKIAAAQPSKARFDDNQDGNVDPGRQGREFLQPSIEDMAAFIAFI